MPPHLSIGTMDRHRMPTYDELRVKLGQVAAERSEWAGLPMLSPDHDLIIEPKFPYQFKKERPDKEPRNIINSWRCDAKGAKIYVERLPSGKSRFLIGANVHGGPMMITTMGAALTAWDVKTEMVAMEKLRAMIGEHKFALYFLTGMFMESSPRSRLTYVFRKLRPTIAMSLQSGEARIVSCLCMHPIGYYSGTWAGCMCPTDDVLAHLCLMRGDEKRYWRMANQHPPHHPESGL